MTILGPTLSSHQYYIYTLSRAEFSSLSHYLYAVWDYTHKKKLALKSFQLVIKRTHSVEIASLYLLYDSAQGHQNSTKYNARAALY